MTDELADLLARARRLERENASLGSTQSPSGDDVDLRSENAMLRHELELLRPSPAAIADEPAQEPDDADEEMPRTAADFNTLPAGRRRQLARSMTRRQRDELLGRASLGDGETDYL